MPSADHPRPEPTTPPEAGRVNGANDINGINGHHDSPEYQHYVPPTRPSTPSSTTPRIMQSQRLAEAPSRNEISLRPAVSASQPPFFTSAPSHAALQRIPVSNMNGSTNGYASSSAGAPQISTPNVTAVSGNRLVASPEDLELSSCTPNLLMPTPQNTPFNSPMAPTRRSGGGPKKKAKFTHKKPRLSAKEKILNDMEAALANSESPVYAHDTLAILQHPEAQLVLSSAPGVELADMSAEELKQTAKDFKSDGIRGFNDLEYLSQAHEASLLRASGEFDEMVEGKFDEFWREEAEAEEYSDDEGDDPNTDGSSGSAAADGPSSMFPDNPGTFETNNMQQQDANPGIPQFDGIDDDGDDTKLHEPEYAEPAAGHHLNSRRDDDDQDSGGTSGSAGVSNGPISHTSHSTSQSNNTYQTHGNSTDRHSSSSYSSNQAPSYPSMCPTQDHYHSSLPPVHSSMLSGGSQVYMPLSMYENGYSTSPGANLYHGTPISYPAMSPIPYAALGASPQPPLQMAQYSGTNPDARSIYASMQAVPGPPQSRFVKLISKLKLDEMWRVKYAYLSCTKEPPIIVGDVLRCSVSPTFSKDIILDGFTTSTALVSVPPRGYQFSDPTQRADIKFPTASTLNNSICGPTMFIPVLSHVEAIVPSLSWEKGISLIRNGQVIGPSLHAVRQAYEFSVREELFFLQLKFAAGRVRRLSPAQADQGFAIIGGCLFQKFHQNENLMQILDVIIDLGDKLNALLASCGSDGSIIVLLDLRILHQDGCPHQLNCTLDDAYNHGPDSFSTAYLRGIAASRSGEHHWSKGHGQLGPKALGFSWGRDTLKGAKFTKADADAVTKFHHDYLGGKRLHYPIPIHRGHSNTFGIYARQYVWSGNSWILDVHCPAPRNLPPAQQTTSDTYSQVFDPPPQTGPVLVKRFRTQPPKSSAPPLLDPSRVDNQLRALEPRSQRFGFIEDQLPSETISGYPSQPEVDADYRAKYSWLSESTFSDYPPRMSVLKSAPEPEQPATKRRREEDDENIDPSLLGL